MDLSGARLRQSNLALSTFNDMNLTGANLSVANLFGARFNRADFSNANLEHATAVGTYFGSSTFTGANLKSANFSGADLTIVKGLTQAQLNQACGDASTRLPKGQNHPKLLLTHLCETCLQTARRREQGLPRIQLKPSATSRMTCIMTTRDDLRLLALASVFLAFSGTASSQETPSRIFLGPVL